MYQYRKLTALQKKGVIEHRRQCGFPLHAPPHFSDGRKLYIVTAACFEHLPIMNKESRRTSFQTRLIDELKAQTWADIRAWVILPNHYHFLASVDLSCFREWVRLFHSGIAKDWNREEQKKGRKVWYRFADRRIRGSRHYFASLNYIHANAVKHGYVKKVDEWKCSSVHDYLAEHGREKLVELWKEYPVDDYGKEWDI